MSDNNVKTLDSPGCSSQLSIVPVAIFLLVSIGCADRNELQKPDIRQRLKEYPELKGAIRTKVVQIYSQWDLRCGSCDYNDSLANFNSMAPKYNGRNQTQCGHADAGCVAVAMGQILNYWRNANTVDWRKIKDTCSTRETAKLLKVVGESLHMRYNVDQSGSSGISMSDLQIVKSSFDSFALNSEVADFDLGSVIKDIDLGRPVILIGCSGSFCHAWIATAYGLDQSNNYHLFMNWGTGYNSWSSASAWNAGGTTFAEKRKMIFNIRPY